jgi:ribonuclease D
MIEALLQEKEIAIDLEHHSERSFQGFTCLMQVSSCQTDFIVDCLEVREHLHLLNQVTTSPQIVKIFHGGKMDVEWLQKDFGVYLINMLDTFELSKQIDSLRQRSLAYLLGEFCSVHVDKSFQMCDWRERPLKKGMIEYAASDTHYLLALKDLLLIELFSQCKNNQQSFEEKKEIIKRDCQRLTKIVYKKPEALGKYYKLIRNDFVSRFGSENHFAIKVFEFLWRKRDELARKHDESLNYIMLIKDLKDLVSYPSHFEKNFKILTNKNKIKFAEEFLEEYTQMKQTFWEEQDDLIVEEEDTLPYNTNEPQLEFSSLKNNVLMRTTMNYQLNQNTNNDPHLIDRNLKFILNSKIKFEVNVESPKALPKSGFISLKESIMSGVDLSKWGTSMYEEQQQESSRRIEEEEDYQPEEDNKNDNFISFEDSQETSRNQPVSQKKSNHNNLLNRIESANLPEGIKNKFIKSVIGNSVTH